MEFEERQAIEKLIESIAGMEDTFNDMANGTYHMVVDRSSGEMKIHRETKDEDDDDTPSERQLLVHFMHVIMHAYRDAQRSFPDYIEDILADLATSIAMGYVGLQYNRKKAAKDWGKIFEVFILEAFKGLDNKEGEEK